MTQHDDVVYLGHMRDVAQQALRMIEGKSLLDFHQDFTLQLAIAHQIQIIGEAGRRISPQGRESIKLNWSEIIGMRNKIVHEYMGVDYDLVWQTAVDDLPILLSELIRLIGYE